MVLPVGDHHYHVPLLRVYVISHDVLVRRIVEDIAYLPQPPFNELFMIVGEMTGHINHLKLKDCVEKKALETKICSATCMDMDHVLHSIAGCLLPDSFFAQSMLDEFNVQPDTYQELLTQHGLAKLGLLDDPWEYGESWYSCYCCLEILAQAAPPECTEQLLCTIWREIYHAIKTVSDSSRPTSNHCLQVLFKVRDVLQSQLSKAPDGAHADNFGDFGNKSVSDVLREALETVDKAIQDSYLIWSIPLVLDPRYKLKRCIQKKFEEAFGSETKKYVCEIRGKIKELYTSYIKDGDDVKDGDDIEDSDGSIEEMSVDSTIPLDQELDEQCGSSHAEMTELDCYLQDSPARQTEGFDILNWWKVHGSVQYPTVARMARDALAMPTCSKLTTDQIAHVKSMLRGYGMHDHQDNGKLMRMREKNWVQDYCTRSAVQDVLGFAAGLIGRGTRKAIARLRSCRFSPSFGSNAALGSFSTAARRSPHRCDGRRIASVVAINQKIQKGVVIDQTLSYTCSDGIFFFKKKSSDGNRDGQSFYIHMFSNKVRSMAQLFAFRDREYIWLQSHFSVQSESSWGQDCCSVTAGQQNEEITGPMYMKQHDIIR
ncbi:unnamed protein product [Urochloa humidicola]